MKTLNLLVGKLSDKKMNKILDNYDASRPAMREIEAAKAKTPEGISAIAIQQARNTELNHVKAGAMAATSVGSLLFQTGKAALRYYMNGIQYETGDSSYAAQIQEFYNDTMTWAGYGMGIVSGAAMGAKVAGPWGGLIGGGAAAIGGGISMGFQNAEARRALNYSIWEDTVKVDYIKARQDVNLYGGGRLR